MATATVTATEYGFMVTGGVDATTINSGKLLITGIGFSGDDDDDTAALTTVRGTSVVSCMKFKTNGNDDDAGMSYISFGNVGIPMTGLAVTLNDTGNVLYVYIK